MKINVSNDSYTIYKHKNLINNKIYIGVTKQKPERRWDNGNGYKTCTHFYNAIQKYGWDNFEHEIIETTSSKEIASELERYWIKFYDSSNPENGYNCDKGGYDGRDFSEETRKKMSESHKGEKNWRYGIPLSEKTKKKISNANKGKLSGEKNPMYGKTHTIEARKKISENLPKERPWAYSPVRCVTTGKEFESIKSATQFYNLGSAGKKITEVCKGRRRSAGKHPETGEPLVWEYIQKEEEYVK